MQRLGIPNDLIDRCQYHLLGCPAVSKHYLLYDFADEKRAACISLGKHIEALLPCAPKRGASAPLVACND